MKHRITLEVDSTKLFDRLCDMKGDTGPVGQRLAEVLLEPTAVHLATDIGLGVYGIEIAEVKELPNSSQPQS